LSPIEFLPAARRDLAGIFVFTEDHFGRRQADQYVSLIAERCTDLARGHRRPRNEDAIRPGLFSYRIKAIGHFAFAGRTGI
jgi:plasmid stabilization system protein ParE